MERMKEVGINVRSDYDDIVNLEFWQGVLDCMVMWVG
jgi:hypothetical protein